MNNLAALMFLITVFGSVGCTMPTPSSGVVIDNENAPGSTDPLIRVWVLSEEQIQNPPATRADAEAVENLVTYPFNLYEFLRQPGNYFVVASNETHFQGLAASDAFEAGVDFSLLQVEVLENGKVNVGAINTDTPTILPALTEL